VTDRLWEPIKSKGYTVYMDRWFSSHRLLDHLQASNTKAVGMIMPNRKEIPKHFSKKL
jgi:hypothetical protein